MGAMRLEVSRAQAQDVQGSRHSGELVHHGPYTVINVSGAGRGWVSWEGNIGRGKFTAGHQSMGLTLIYRGQGRYTFELTQDSASLCEGRAREQMPKEFALVEKPGLALAPTE